MDTKELFGKEVLDANAKRIGKVADMDFTMPDGLITHIVVKAGLTKKYHVALGDIRELGDSIVLRVGEDELGKKSR